MEKIKIIDNINSPFEIKIFTEKIKYKTSKTIEKNLNAVNPLISFYLPVQLIFKRKLKFPICNMLYGQLPLMVERGTFIINGHRRVLINQIIKSPGVCYYSSFDKDNIRILTAVVRNYNNFSIEFFKQEDLMWIKTEENKKIPLFLLLLCLGITKKKILSCIDNQLYAQNLFQSLELDINCSPLQALNTLKQIIEVKTIVRIKLFIEIRK